VDGWNEQRPEPAFGVLGTKQVRSRGGEDRSLAVGAPKGLRLGRMERQETEARA
jgi:hypothetical protein